jgi:hypothetical protein
MYECQLLVLIPEVRMYIMVRVQNHTKISKATIRGTIRGGAKPYNLDLVRS